MNDRNLYQRFGLLLILAALASLPLVLPAATRALEGNANNPEDWLPPGNPEVVSHHGFSSKFGSDEILVASWPGCTLDDDRLRRLAEALRQATSIMGDGN